MGICYLIGPCDCGEMSLDIQNEDYVIAVDKGYLMQEKYGIKADIAVGDFDSLGYIPNDCDIIVHPVRKDDTDSALALKHAYEKGYRKFVIIGAAGGDRPDHTLANISLLVWLAERGCIGYLVGNSYAYAVIKNSKLIFSADNEGDVSVFSLSQKSCGVRESGLSYELENAELSYDFPLGVSNRFMGRESEISVKDGTLLIYWQTDYKKLYETVKNNEAEY